MHLPQTSPEQAKNYFQAKLAFTAGPVEVARMLEDKEPVNIVDVRAKKDFDKGHLPSAVNLPQEEWSNLQGLAKDKLNVVYCYSIVCHLAAKAAVEFSTRGYRVMEMEGGFEAWKNYKLDIETAKAQK